MKLKGSILTYKPILRDVLGFSLPSYYVKAFRVFPYQTILFSYQLFVAPC